MPCHHRWSQCEQLYILIGSALTVISITTSSRERQVGHFIPCGIDRTHLALERMHINIPSTLHGPRRRGAAGGMGRRGVAEGGRRGWPGVAGRGDRQDHPKNHQWMLTTLMTAAALKAMWAAMDIPSLPVLQAR
jgi:hypothetical protein